MRTCLAAEVTLEEVKDHFQLTRTREYQSSCLPLQCGSVSVRLGRF